MDSATFDSVTRNLGRVVSRRAALGGLLAGTLAATAGTMTETEAKRRKGKGKGKRRRTLRPGERCQTTRQCQHIDGYICAQERIFSEERVCCGGIDALCDETGAGGRSCCYGYLCASGRCIVV